MSNDTVIGIGITIIGDCIAIGLSLADIVYPQIGWGIIAVSTMASIYFLYLVLQKKVIVSYCSRSEIWETYDDLADLLDKYSRLTTQSQRGNIFTRIDSEKKRLSNYKLSRLIDKYLYEVSKNEKVLLKIHDQQLPSILKNMENIIKKEYGGRPQKNTRNTHK
ncbi:MAG: hypothetical protein JXA46_16615 [Dehalococcoidales bacterium]|nr:hypothetical protein [Dehalococcoidales bacterium]